MTDVRWGWCFRPLWLALENIQTWGPISSGTGFDNERKIYILIRWFDWCNTRKCYKDVTEVKVVKPGDRTEKQTVIDRACHDNFRSVRWSTPITSDVGFEFSCFDWDWTKSQRRSLFVHAHEGTSLMQKDPNRIILSLLGQLFVYPVFQTILAKMFARGVRYMAWKVACSSYQHFRWGVYYQNRLSSHSSQNGPCTLKWGTNIFWKGMEIGPQRSGHHYGLCACLWEAKLTRLLDMLRKGITPRPGKHWWGLEINQSHSKIYVKNEDYAWIIPVKWNPSEKCVLMVLSECPEPVWQALWCQVVLNKPNWYKVFFCRVDWIPKYVVNEFHTTIKIFKLRSIHQLSLCRECIWHIWKIIARCHERCKMSASLLIKHFQ